MIGKMAYLLIACVLPVAVAAEEFPKQGTANYSIYSVSVMSRRITPGEGNSFRIYELNGVTRNDDGNQLFNNMGIRCLASNLTTNGYMTVRGACILVDKDGDQIFTNYEDKSRVGESARGADQFVGGTGKYTGITGKADFTGQAVKGPDDTFMVVVRDQATWTMQ